MIVTPKEIDELIENMKDVVARGINYAMQKILQLYYITKKYLHYKKKNK